MSKTIQAIDATRWKEAEMSLQVERRKISAVLADAEPLSADKLAEGWQEVDSPSEDEIREVEYSRRQALHQRLRQIDAALERRSAGVYAHCVQCGAKISAKRLEADRAVALCLDCQTASESGYQPPSL